MLTAPSCEKKERILECHGDIRIDPYFWLNEKENPKLLKYLEEENTFHQNWMAPYLALENSLFQEMKSRIKADDDSAPVRYKNYDYFLRYSEGKEYAQRIRRHATSGIEEIILDENVLAEGHNYFALANSVISPDEHFLAYCADTLSRRLYTLYIFDRINHALTDISIPNTSGSIVWASDSKSLYYVSKDEALRESKVYHHILGQPAESDTLLYFEEDEAYHVDIQKSKSEQYLLISCHSTLTTEYYFLDLDQPGAITLFQQRIHGIDYDVDHNGEHWYIRTNWDALNFRMMKTKSGYTNNNFWEEVIAHREDCLLEGFTVFHDRIVIVERIDGLKNVRTLMNNGGSSPIEFDEIAYDVDLGPNPELYADFTRIIYSSLTTPLTHYNYSGTDQKFMLVKQQEIPGSFTSSDYVSEKHFAVSHDGERVPISLVYRKSEHLKGTRPLLLYGYGSYGISIDPSFNQARLSLLDRGFIFAIAHVRGGQEKGRIWYESGKLLKKKNTFLDFIACGEYVIQQGLTSADTLFAYGGSAGGLLMGAVANLRPDLWRGIIAAVPFVDVVTTMLDESIPLTTYEYDEWGNPNIKEYYDYMKTYSPYDNVKTQEYPAILILTGFHDSQVQYWEPAKWTAKLRDHQVGKQVILFHCNLSTGHGGFSGRYEKYKERAMEYTFLLSLLEQDTKK